MKQNELDCCDTAPLMLPSGIYSNGWLLDGALLGPGSIPCCQIKLVVVGWITTQGLEMTEEKLPLLFHLAMVKLFQSSWVMMKTPRPLLRVAFTLGLNLML